MKKEARNDDSASTDLVLRCYAPEVIAVAYRATHAGVGDARDKLGWRLGFVDIVQRFLLAVLAAEHAGLALPACNELATLVNKLETPSLGDVSKANEALARALLMSTGGLVAPEIPRLLLAPAEGTDKLECTPFAKHIGNLIALRNTVVHSSGTIIPPESKCATILTEITAPLREICAALRILGKYPLLYLHRMSERQDGTISVTLLRLVGTEPQPHDAVIADSTIRLPTGVPLLLSEAGDALLLSPWLVVAPHAAHGRLESRLLQRWCAKTKGFEYSALDGGTSDVIPQQAQATTWARADLAGPKASFMRKRAAVTPEIAGVLRGRAENEGMPKVPGFRLHGKLGTGASSTVYVGRELLSGKPPGPRVAVKVLHPAVTTDPVQRARLEREHYLLSGLNHPSIVKVLQYIDSPGPCLVMEYVEGEDLQSATERRCIGVNRAVSVVESVLAALAAAHQQGVIHRDVKPSNVLVDLAGNVRLIDFGIATAEQLVGQTRTLDAVGTVLFAAPEQLSRVGEIGPTADLYSAGRLLEFLATGLLGPAGGPPPEVPAGLQAIIRRATQREVAWRFQSAGEFANALSDGRQAGWGGAPVQSGDRLNESYELHGLAGMREGIFAFIAAEIASDEVVTILVAGRDQTVETRLTEAIQQCSRGVRRTLGHPRLQLTADRLRFAVLAGTDPIEDLAALLGNRPPHVSASRENGPSTVDGRLTDGIPERLRAIGAGALGDRSNESVFQVTRLVDTLTRVLHAQIAHAAGAGIDARTWREISRWTFGQVLRELWSAKSRPPAHLTTALVEELRFVAELRNEAAHGQGSLFTPGQVLRATRAAEDLARVIETLATSTAPPRFLWPVVAACGPNEDEWGVLTGSGTKAMYVSLREEGKVWPIGERTAIWLAPISGDVGSSAARSKWEERARQVEVMAGQQIAELGFVGAIEERAQVKHGGRTRVADYLVRTKNRGSPLFVAEASIAASVGHNDRNFADKLWILATAFEVPFAGLFDGERWRWFRYGGREGLILLEGTSEMENYSLQR